MSSATLAFALTHPEMANFDQPINVYNPGGMVQTIVHFKDHRYWIELIGNATVTHIIQVDETNLHQANVHTNNTEIKKTDEETAYDQFVNGLPKTVAVDVKE